MGALRAMVLNHEQETPPVRTLINKVYYKLSLAIHLFVVGLIIARGYVSKPLFIIEIPPYCFLDAFLKLELALRSSVGRGG